MQLEIMNRRLLLHGRLRKSRWTMTHINEIFTNQIQKYFHDEPPNNTINHKFKNMVQNLILKKYIITLHFMSYTVF